MAESAAEERTEVKDINLIERDHAEGGEERTLVALPESITRLVSEGRLAWEAVETALTNTLQALVDDAWIRVHVSELETVFPDCLAKGFSPEEQHLRHGYLLRTLLNAHTRALREFFSSGETEALVRGALTVVLMCAKDNIHGAVAVEDRERYFAAFFHVLMDMLFGLDKRPLDLEVPEGVAKAGHFTTVLADPQTGNKWIILVKEGGKKRVKRAMLHVAQHVEYYQKFCESNIDVLAEDDPLAAKAKAKEAAEEEGEVAAAAPKANGAGKGEKSKDSDERKKSPKKANGPSKAAAKDAKEATPPAPASADADASAEKDAGAEDLQNEIYVCVVTFMDDDVNTFKMKKLAECSKADDE